MLYRKKRGTLKPHHSSIVLNLKPVFAARNIKHPTAYLIGIGINNSTVSKMLRGDAVQVNFRQLTTMCINLKCTPNELFALRDLPLPKSHPLQKLRQFEPDKNQMTVDEFLSGKTVEEVEALLKIAATIGEASPTEDNLSDEGQN